MLFNTLAQFLNQNYFGQTGEMENSCYAMINFLLLIKELSRHSFIFIRTLKIRGFQGVLKKIYL